MAIIQHIDKYNTPQEVLLKLYPDQFVSEGNTSGFGTNDNNQLTYGGMAVPMPAQHTGTTTKRSKDWWKINMDYFYTVALAQYNSRRRKIVRNYELMKGKLTPEDFYLEGPIMSFTDKLMEDVDLPSYVQHYPILNPPVNTMVGEKSKRRDNSRPKATDADSQSEEGQFYTNLWQEYTMANVRQTIASQLKSKGADVSNLEGFEQQVDEMTQEKMQQYTHSYSSEAEIWASRMIESLKIEFRTKEMFEGGFRDLLICNQEFFHNYEDRSKTGFRSEKVNPKNVWWLTTPDKKYIRDAYAAGLVEVMELSEILDKFDLDEKEVEHLRTIANQAFFPFYAESNFFNNKTGGESINYNAYDPAVLQMRNYMESEMTYANNNFDGFLGNAASNVQTFGNRFIVTTSYWKSKRKIGLLTYEDIDGNVQSTMVDDTYKNKQHPGQIELNWKWENQWYKGVKIGFDIYYVQPLEIVDYCPIIGVVHELENTESTSLVDLMKPFQTLYNVCMNQLYRLLEKEKGKVFIMNKRFVPILQGGNYEDSLEIWERQAEENGTIWVDDRAENLKGGPVTFNQMTVVDLTLSQQMQTRYDLAVQLKNECWELVGITRQRTGSTVASETATGINTAISQSYAQTEPYFVQQEYIENQQLQCMLDIAQYIECRNPESTLGFIDDQGGNQFCKIQTELHLKNRDIKLFMSSRSQDMELNNKIEQLTQAALQNGASFYEVAQMYSNNSQRAKMDILKQLHEHQRQMETQAQQQQQEQLQQQQQQFQYQQQKDEQDRQDTIQLKMHEIDTKANTELTVARLKESIQLMKDIQSTESDPNFNDIITLGLKQQEGLYRRDMDAMKMSMDQQKMQQDQQQANIQNSHNERKLDLQQEANDIKKDQVKKQAANKSVAK